MTTELVQNDQPGETAAMTEPSSLWPRGRSGLAAGGALAFIVAGFLLLAYLGTFVDHPRGLRGFWDYPSGVIGDGLILPALLVALIIQVNKIGPPQNAIRLRRWQIGLGVAGAVIGAATPLSWLVLNNGSALLWMLPRPHHFDAAGWVHLGYATVVTGIVGALVGRLLEGLDSGASREEVSAQAMTSIVGLGLGMLVLIGRDSLIGIHGSASPANLAGEVVLGALLLLALAVKSRRVTLAAIGSDGLIVFAFLVGLIGMIIGWTPRAPAVTGIGWAALVLAASGAATMARPRGGEYRIDVALACGTLLAAGLWRSESALDHHHAAALIWGLAAAASACGLLAFEARRWGAIFQALRYGFFFVYCLVQFYLAQNLLVSTSARDLAVPSLAVSDTAFDLMVFSLIQTRFGGMAEGDNKMFENEYVEVGNGADFDTKLKIATQKAKKKAERERLRRGRRELPAMAEEGDEQESTDTKPMLELGLLGFAVAIALLTLLSTAATPLGLDRQTRSPALVRLVMVVTAAALGLTYCYVAKWRWSEAVPEVENHTEFGPDELALRGTRLLPATLVAGLWLVALLVLTGGRIHLGLVAAATGVVMGALYGKSLTFSSFDAQTLKRTRLQSAFALWIAAVLGFSDAWLVGVGLWQGQHPLSGWWLAGNAIAVFVGSTAVFLFASQTLARGLPSGQREDQQLLSRQAVTTFNYLDGSVYGLNYLICIILPLYAATRDRALHGATLNVVASMFFLPGLLTAVIWGLENWKAIDEKTQKTFFVEKRVSLALLIRTQHKTDEALKVEEQRVDALHRHWTFQRAAVYSLMVIGLGYLAWVLLRF